jgi:hypothetical protein
MYNWVSLSKLVLIVDYKSGSFRRGAIKVQIANHLGRGRGGGRGGQGG